MAQVEERGTQRKLLLIHVEVQRTRQRQFGQRILDYYTLLRRTTNLPVLPYAVLLYPDDPACGHWTYEERFHEHIVASLTYFQVSLPSLDAQLYAASDHTLCMIKQSWCRPPATAVAVVCQAPALRRTGPAGRDPPVQPGRRRSGRKYGAVREH